MPYVILRTHERFFTPEEEVPPEKHPLRMFTEYLAKIVADALSVPGTDLELTAADVEVEVREFGKYDFGHVDMKIIVFANGHPERSGNLEDRRKLIELAVNSWFSSSAPGSSTSLIKGASIWIPLVAGGAYGEFTP